MHYPQGPRPKWRGVTSMSTGIYYVSPLAEHLKPRKAADSLSFQGDARVCKLSRIAEIQNSVVMSRTYIGDVPSHFTVHITNERLAETLADYP